MVIYVESIIMHKNIIIIGAGASGIGMGVVLQKMKLDFTILEQATIGESFRKWPSGTRFISPSFTGNFFGSPDLNAVTPDTSPAFVLNTEHPSGEEYAIYLQRVAAFFKLPVQENTKVTSLKKDGEIFLLTTDTQEYTADAVIWAGGEYQYPKTQVCEGAELAVHNTRISDLAELQGNLFPIIGGYESGFDTAIQLAKLGKKSVIFDSGDHLHEQRSDSSFSLSPYTKDRIRQYSSYFIVKPRTRVEKIERKGDKYLLTTSNDETITSDTQPILATGFETSLIQVKDFFDWQGGSVQLTQHDESTKVENFYLIGPQVRHQNVIFCFVYKYRQRFGVVAKAIAEKHNLGNKQDVEQIISDYKQQNFYLDDLSCCGDECAC